MKFAIISTMAGFPWGGSEELWFRTALYAADKKDNVQVWHYNWKDRISPKINILRESGIFVHLLELPGKQKSKTFIERIASKLKVKKQKNPYQQVLEMAPDVVLISQGDTFGFLKDANLCNLINQIGDKCYLLCQYNHEHLILKTDQIKTANCVLKKVKRVLFVSQRNLEMAQHQLASKIERVVVVQNPVNLETKELLAYPQISTIQFASVARLDCRYKGQDLLLAAFAAPFWREQNWILNLYGTGPDQAYLEKLVQYYGLENKVFFKGQVSDIVAVWRENHIQVLCSFGEGTPLSLIEAFFCGRPAIVTDVGDNTKYTIDGETGFIIPAPTIQLISETLKRAFDHRTDWAKMGQRAHNQIKEQFHSDPSYQLYQLFVN